jgi:hypothetical protein
MWVALAVGEIISCSGTSDAYAARDYFKLALARTASLLAYGNRMDLSLRYFGRSEYLPSLMMGGAAIQIDTFLTTVYKLGIPLSAILRGFDLDSFQPQPHGEPSSPSRPFVRTRSKLLELLTDALRNGLAVSVTELAHSLGYSSGRYIKMRAPEICRKIEEKFRAARRRAPQCSSHEIEESLKKNLAKQQPEAVGVISQSCGVDAEYLGRYWPDLCKRTRQKRLRIDSERATRALKHAMKTVPPTPLSKVVRSLGWRSTHRIWTIAPEMTRLLNEVNEEYRKKLFQQWKSQLEACAIECPPPSVTEAGQRMRTRVSTLRYHFPKQMKIIASDALSTKMIYDFDALKSCSARLLTSLSSYKKKDSTPPLIESFLGWVRSMPGAPKT